MNGVRLGIACALAITTQAFGFFDPPYPEKSEPPFRGTIVIVDDDEMVDSSAAGDSSADNPHDTTSSDFGNYYAEG